MFEIKSVSKHYKGQIALNQVSLSIADGESVSLIGESGSGKSTLSRLILALEKPTTGNLFWNGKSVGKLKRLELYKDIQVVFQDNTSCFNPRMKIYESLCEPIDNFLHLNKVEKEHKISSLLEMVGLSKDIAFRYPHEISGGQQKRVCIARAISVNPKLIILDEAVSGLDATVKVKILVLLKELQKEIGHSYLFITHDLKAALFMSRKIIVMQNGAIVETVSNISSLSAFTHPFSKKLVGSRKYKSQ